MRIRIVWGIRMERILLMVLARWSCALCSALWRALFSGRAPCMALPLGLPFPLTPSLLTPSVLPIWRFAILFLPVYLHASWSAYSVSCCVVLNNGCCCWRSISPPLSPYPQSIIYGPLSAYLLLCLFFALPTLQHLFLFDLVVFQP